MGREQEAGKGAERGGNRQGMGSGGRGRNGFQETMSNSGPWENKQEDLEMWMSAETSEEQVGEGAELMGKGLRENRRVRKSPVATIVVIVWFRQKPSVRTKALECAITGEQAISKCHPRTTYSLVV